MCKEKLFEVIDKLKQELNTLIVDRAEYDLILKKSQELDCYISKGMKVINNKNKVL
ncbi:MAG: Spo0E family sporulation regulatory protein-aspartic acid phosphatase [Candidatus Nanoarchaeia archaeon]|nr:Spo0E family sporulation regulatory protein-aspartic acid phosphatase [Candidatus Nanoarchaeia archaeon]